MRKFGPFLIGSGLGVVYGGFYRFIGDGSGAFGILTLAFIFGVPGTMGYLAVRPLTAPRWWQKTFVAWIPWLLAVGLAALVGAEGAICIALATPPALLMASIGGFLAGSRAGKAGVTLPIVLALPVALGPVENSVKPPADFRAVHTTIEIHASPQTVWEQIREVRTISPVEHGNSFFNLIGFPRPLEARLVGAGVGAVRRASFERGVVFFERVTAWEERHRLAFEIHADPASIPRSTLDQHVVIGSRYFDVLDGEYLLEEVRPGVVQLHLTSHHRLATTIAPYAHLWSDAILSSVQERIVKVVRARSETGGQQAAKNANEEQIRCGLHGIVCTAGDGGLPSLLEIVGGDDRSDGGATVEPLQGDSEKKLTGLH
jgi:hypothetical protein